MVASCVQASRTCVLRSPSIDRLIGDAEEMKSNAKVGKRGILFSDFYGGLSCIL